MSAVSIAVGDALIRCVESGATPISSPVTEALTAALRAEQGTNLLGLVFYGSQLNRTAGPRSDWDFFVIVEDYERAHGRRGHAWLNRILPPSIYRREVAIPDGSVGKCKLSILSLRDLERFTSTRARDSYAFGRLSKRVSVIFARDAEARAAILAALARSVALCAAWTLAEDAGAISTEALARAAVAFSYRCEERVEGPSRAVALFDTDAAHFRAVYAAAAAALEDAGRLRIEAGGGRIEPIRSEPERRRARAAVIQFVRRSRRRARLRWLKNVWTFEGWDDYMLTKLERHQGLRIELSERERRHALLAALRHYVRLRREGRLTRGGPARKGAPIR